MSDAPAQGRAPREWARVSYKVAPPGIRINEYKEEAVGPAGIMEVRKNSGLMPIANGHLLPRPYKLPLSRTKVTQE